MRFEFRTSATTATLAAVALLGAAPAHAEPGGCPTGAATDGTTCVVKLTAVTANSADGSLTGTPAGGSAPITVMGQADSYQLSTGFGGNPPDLVQQWDDTIRRVRDANPSDPNWYGQGKSAAFLPRQLNDLATRLPAGTIVLRSVPDPSDSHLFTLQSIQPVGP
jgi:hypothetical protein